MKRSEPRVALVHDWLVSSGGSERVLYQLHQMWPTAQIYTAAYEPEIFPEFADADIRTTWLNRIKLAKTRHQLFSIPRAWVFRRMDLSDYDIVISSCSAESKYVHTGPHTLHICYCYTPIRYYWSDYQWHLKHPPFSGLLGVAAKVTLRLLIGYLRRQDFRLAQRVDLYITQSDYIRARIKRYYQRDAVIIHPGIDTTKYSQLTKRAENYYLIVGRQVAYKRLDLAVEAFNRLGERLVVAGTGREVSLQQPRANNNIEFLGYVGDDELLRLYANAKAVIYPQEEDYGLVPVEAQAAGTPVIAYGRGGAAETVVDGRTGVLFDEQTPDGLIKGVKRFESLKFDPAELQAHARKFDEAIFKRDLKAYVDRAWAEFAPKRKA